MEKFVLPEARLHEFEKEYEINGKKETGKFKCRVPSVMDTLAIQSTMSNYLKDVNLDTMSNTAADLFFMIATLEVLLVESPEWFNAYTLDYDEAYIIREVYEEVDTFKRTFRDRDGKDGHIETSGPGESKAAVEGE